MNNRREIRGDVLRDLGTKNNLNRPRFPFVFQGWGSLTTQHQLGQNQLDSSLIHENVSMSR